MKLTNTFPILLLFLLSSCYSNENSKPNFKNNSSGKNNLPDSVLISPIYTDSVYFVVNAQLSNITEVTGNLDSFHNSIKHTHELYFQRFVENEHRFRVIHAVGKSIETTNEFGKEINKTNSFNDTIKFNLLGIFSGDPGDPVELIPLYPGHKVKPGEYWKPEAKVKTGMGSGIAKYQFVIDSLFKDDNENLLARMRILVNADLEPTAALKGGKVIVSGGGYIIWDCTINQRRETHLKAIYLGIKNQNQVKQLIKVDDKLIAEKGQKQF